MAEQPTNQELETILDYCIDQMQTGKPMEECLAQFPEYRQELEPMLQMTVRLGELENPAPSARTINEALFEIGQRSQTQKQAQKESATFLPAFLRQPWVVRTVNALLIVVVLFFGLSTASAGSVPGDLLYPFKKLTENVRFLLTTGQQDKAELRLTFSEKRLRELSALYRKTGRVNEALIQAMLRDAEAALQVHTASDEGPSYLMTKARHLNDAQKDYLDQLQPRVQGRAREAVDQAIQTCNRRGERMQQMRRGMMKNMPMMRNGRMGGMRNMMGGRR